MPERLRGVYVGFNLYFTAEARAYQQLLCDRLRLYPSSQIHVTLDHIGNQRVDTLREIVTFMRGAKHWLPQTFSIDITGIGVGADVGENTVSQVFDIDPWRDRGRVAWWSALESPTLKRLRHRWCQALERNGLRVPWHLREDSWTPHVTLGTDGTPPEHYYHGWRTSHHVPCSIAATADVPLPTSLNVEWIHLTNGQTHPNSLLPIWTFRS
jgi:2'-5' RNA ligase